MRFLRFTIILYALSAIACNRSTSQSQTVDYNKLKENIELRRKAFQQIYLTETNQVKKDSLIQQVREYIFTEIVNEVLPAWYGTPWSFEGTTTEPKTGSIACGYFVTTALRDAGFKLPRIKWAQVPSETLIKSITDKNNIKRYSNADIAKVKTAIKSMGRGLYIVGLDVHVGFIVNTGSSVTFVHSNYYEPSIGVVAQQLNSVNPLRDSKYRVIGKVLNDEMIIRWLTGASLDS